MQSNPLISSIIPIYNCDKYLAQALESVLEQTNQNIEISFADDGSNAGSIQVNQKILPKIRYSFQENICLVAAPKLIPCLSKRNFVAFLNSDDL